VITLPTTLFDLHAPGFVLCDLVAYFLFDYLLDVIQARLTPIVHWHPLDGVLKNEGIIAKQIATPTDNIAVIKARAYPRDAVHGCALYLRVIVAEALEYLDNVVPRRSEAAPGIGDE
jgi:hypothetical protein